MFPVRTRRERPTAGLLTGELLVRVQPGEFKESLQLGSFFALAVPAGPKLLPNFCPCRPM
jgi:hypothetical protein